jgi:hypothetical protein
MLSRMRLEREKHGVAPDISDEAICHCLLGIGFVRKRRPYDCGNPRCLLCHSEKYLEPNARANKKRAAIDYELTAAG